jgi:hypothetical protein
MGPFDGKETLKLKKQNDFLENFHFGELNVKDNKRAVE